MYGSYVKEYAEEIRREAVMMVLVLGGSGSGKSAYAEELLCTLAGKSQTTKYSLAAMRVYDEEGTRKVEKHRERRKGKGFLTIEQPVRIEDALFQMKSGGKSVLLECISNLTANEMFTGTQIRPKEAVTACILRGVSQLMRETAHLVVVSGNVFEDGIVYNRTTMDYMYAMGEINRQLAACADRVVEVVAGIPVPVRGVNPEAVPDVPF